MKSYMIGAIALVMLSGAGGLYLYVNHLQKENAILEGNNKVLELAAQEDAEEIEFLKRDRDAKLEQSRARMRQISNLEQVNARLNGELNELTKDNQVLNECLSVPASDDLVDQLREYAGGQAGQ